MANIRFKTVYWGKIGLIVAGLILSSSSAIAQVIEFPPTGNRSGPVRTAGGGTRGGWGCTAAVPAPLTAIAPTSNWVKTAAAESTLFWYVPPTVATEALFELYAPDGDLIYSTTVALSGEASIVSLTLPAEVKMMPEQVYDWALTVLCDAENINLNPFVNGWISRVEPDSTLVDALADADDELARAQAYAQAELWPETLAIAAELRATQPEIWQQLLTSVGLESIAGVPFIVIPSES